MPTYKLLKPLWRTQKQKEELAEAWRTESEWDLWTKKSKYWRKIGIFDWRMFREVITSFARRHKIYRNHKQLELDL